MKRFFLVPLIALGLAVVVLTGSASAQSVSSGRSAHQRFAGEVSYALYVAELHTREPEEQLWYSLHAEPKELKLAAQWTQRKWENAENSYEKKLYKIHPPKGLAQTWKHYLNWQKRVITAGYHEVAQLEALDWHGYQEAVQRTNAVVKHREVFFKRLHVRSTD
jgi:hypothetical protein